MSLEKVTVFGTGNLGSQIMMQAAYHGKQVVGYDVAQEFLDKLPQRWEWLRTRYRNEVSDYSDAKFDEAVKRISATTDVAQAVSDADIVIEAVPETLELKNQVWRQIAEHVPAKTVLTTNTSTLLPSSFAEATGAPERFLALHFANNIWRLNIGEVMGHAGTDPKYVEAVKQFAEEIGLVPAVIRKEHPGYILNSLLVPWLDAAALLYARGVATPKDIDNDWRISTGSPKGPFEAYDVVGFNVAAHIARNNHAGDPDFERFATMLEEAAAAGRGGIGDGEGFYVYDADGNITGESEHFALDRVKSE